ncbi:MAG: lipopolysaccharide biosynthesis protein, partial [Acidimicrobiales bacterium]
PFGFRLPSWREVRSGLAFTSNQVSATALKDLDKVMLGSFGFSAQNADYTAGHRFVALGLLPLQAAMSGSYGEFFRRGIDGKKSLTRLTVRMSLATLPPMAVIAALMYVAAPGIPWLLGAEYQDSVTVVRYLAFLPALKALQGFVGNALTARGDHGWRLANMIVAVSFNAALNFYLIPRNGWRGAAVSTMVAEVLLTIGLWAVLLGKGASRSSDDDPDVDLRGRKTRAAEAGSLGRSKPSESSRSG